MEVDGWKMANVREQTYFRVILSEDARIECELEKRISAALNMCSGGSQRSSFEAGDMSKNAKIGCTRQR